MTGRAEPPAGDGRDRAPPDASGCPNIRLAGYEDSGADGALHRLILDSLPDYIAVVDGNGVIVFTNPAWQAFAERNEAGGAIGLAGSRYLDVCVKAMQSGDATAAAALGGIRAVLDGSESLFTLEYDGSAPGEERWFLMTVVSLAGAQPGAVISHRDITAARRAQQQAADSCRQIEAVKDALHEQLRFDHLVAELSARFVNVQTPDVDAAILRSLHEIVRFFDLERCDFAEVAKDGHAIAVVGSALAQRPPAAGAEGPLHERFPWATARVVAHGLPLCVTDAAGLAMQPEAGAEEKTDARIRSLALIPIAIERNPRYVLIAASTRQRAWPARTAPRLKLLGEIFANAIIRRRMRERKRQLIAFQALIADVTARFVALAPEALDREIGSALHRIRDFFGADHCGLFELAREAPAARLRYLQSTVAFSDRPLEEQYARRFPWAYEELIHGRIVVFATLSDLPPQARADRRAFRSGGVRAGLNIPIMSGGEVVFAFGIACSRELPPWPDEYIPRLRLLGETIANALIRKRAETALRASTRRLEYALSATVEGVWDWNLRTGETYFSPAWIESLGYGREEVPPHVSFWEGIVHPDDMPRVQEALRAHFAGETSVYNVENRLRRKTGEYRWNAHRGRVVEREDDGRPVRMVGTDTDITERKRVEGEMSVLRDQLWHMDRVARAGMLSASIAHEINQPLAAILSNVQTALRLLDGEGIALDELRAILRDIERDDRRAAAVIASLRSMLRRQKTARRELDLSTIILAILDVLHTELVMANVKVTTRFMRGCRVTVDEAQLQQVLLNLLMNAIESMGGTPAASRGIVIETAPCGQRLVQCVVHDSGPGIYGAGTDAVFSPFLTTKDDGTGLGLAVSRAIIEAHGGAIEAENPVDGGALFRFTLPSAAAAQSMTGGATSVS